MNVPAYPNLMDINSTIKGTMQELLKEHNETQQINIPQQSTINNPLTTWTSQQSLSSVGGQTLLQPHRSLLLSGVVFMFYI